MFVERNTGVKRVDGALVVALAQDRQAYGADVRLSILDGLAVAGTGNRRGNHIVGKEHSLAHAHIPEEVVGEQAIEGLA